MRSDILTWLAGTGSWAWHTALSLFILLNAVAVGAFFTTRNRSLVEVVGQFDVTGAAG